MRNYAVTLGKPRKYIFFDGIDLPKTGVTHSRAGTEQAKIDPESVATFYQITDELGRVRSEVKRIGHNPNRAP